MTLPGNQSRMDHVKVFRMDSVYISIIESPNPLDNYTTSIPTHHTSTLKFEEPVVAHEIERFSMLKKEQTHREIRLQIINEWANKGVQESRSPFSAEKQFRELTQAAPFLFKPVKLHLDHDVIFQREISYLIDAFDMLPSRPDIAFDSAWKAFELETKVHYPGKDSRWITPRLYHYAPNINPELIRALTASIPMQTCEHIYKILVTNNLRHISSGADSRINTLLTSNDNAAKFINYLRSRYTKDTDIERRKGAALVRKALQGEKIILDKSYKSDKSKNSQSFTLNEASRSQIIILLYLWTIRNDRYHGDSFSPFISSTANARTFASIFYAFLVTYYLITWFWTNERPQVILGNIDTIIGSADQNLTNLSKLFKHHWNK